MREFWLYDIEIAENYFEIDLVSPAGRREVCWVLNGYRHNIDILHPILCKGLMVGDGNHAWGDIFLNYIWYNKDVNTAELHGLSLAIKDHCVRDYGYYTNLGVDSVDLSKITDYIELRDERWKSRLPFKIKGVEVLEYNFHALCKSMEWNYKKNIQFRRDITKACLTPMGRNEFDNFIFYYNVESRTRN